MEGKLNGLRAVTRGDITELLDVNISAISLEDIWLPPLRISIGGIVTPSNVARAIPRQ